MAQKTFDLQMSGLLTILADHIYTTERVAIRELIQNAHDAIQRHIIKSDDKSYQPRISFSIDGTLGLITITDNGTGLTQDEIENYLTRIGASGTGDFASGLIGQSESYELVGRFGIGFLSAFALANRVVLTTRSRVSDQTLVFQCNGDEYYELIESEGGEYGTKIELELKPEFDYLFDEYDLIAVIRQYADFLPLPIYVNDHSEPINQMDPPWDEQSSVHAAERYIRDQFNDKPICVIPLSDQVLNLGHDSITVPLRGFLWIPVGGKSGARKGGDTQVYIRRMMIDECDYSMLPSQANFVRAVIECPSLLPTASRETIVEDETYHAVCKAMEELLCNELTRLAEEEPETWKTIVLDHSNSMMEWANQNVEFFQRVADIIPVPTSQGRMPLPEYLSKSKGNLYITQRHESSSLQDRLLAEKNAGVPTIDAHYGSVDRFINRWLEHHPHIKSTVLDCQSTMLLRPANENRFARLVEFFEQQDIDVRVASFEPADQLPLLLTYTETAQHVRDANEALDARNLPKHFADFLESYVDQKKSDVESVEGTVVINAKSKLITRLADENTDQRMLGLVLGLLYQQARLFADPTIRTPDGSQALGQISTTILEMIK